MEENSREFPEKGNGICARGWRGDPPAAPGDPPDTATTPFVSTTVNLVQRAARRLEI